MKNISLQEFYDMLDKHDWMYYFSDDFQAYQDGQVAEARLWQIAKNSEKHEALIREYELHVTTGPHWNTKQNPKPNRPI